MRALRMLTGLAALFARWLLRRPEKKILVHRETENDKRAAAALAAMRDAKMRADYRACDTCAAFLTQSDGDSFTCRRCADARRYPLPRLWPIIKNPRCTREQKPKCELCGKNDLPDFAEDSACIDCGKRLCDDCCIEYICAPCCAPCYAARRTDDGTREYCDLCGENEVADFASGTPICLRCDRKLCKWCTFEEGVCNACHEKTLGGVD